MNCLNSFFCIPFDKLVGFGGFDSVADLCENFCIPINNPIGTNVVIDVDITPVNIVLNIEPTGCCVGIGIDGLVT